MAKNVMMNLTTLEPLLWGTVSEELSQTERTREKILGLLAQVKTIPDGIHRTFLTDFKHENVDFLSSILSLKLPNVTPVFKRGSRRDPVNYRPLTITFALGGLVETVTKEIMSLLMDQKMVKQQETMSWNKQTVFTMEACTNGEKSKLHNIIGAVEEAPSINFLYHLHNFLKDICHVSFSSSFSGLKRPRPSSS